MGDSGPSGAVVCRKCGASNAAGDQFCGGCGAYLEWAAEPAAQATAQPRADRATDMGPPTMATPAPSAAAPATTQLVRCPTCGTANVAGRTFCQKCGGKLAAATTVTASRMLPRATGGAERPLAAPIPTPTTATTGRRREPMEKGSGIPGWLGIAGAGIVVGAVVVAIVLLLGSGSPPPPTSASSAPSASASAPTSPSPSVSTSSRGSALTTSK